MSTIIEEKKALRKQVRQLKNALQTLEREQMEKAIFAQLEAWDRFKKANVVLMYWAMDDEVNTKQFVDKWGKDKTILLPVVDGDNLLLRIYQGKESMVPGALFGIPEPVGDLFTRIEDIDMIIVPGVAFDKQNHRMGRGRGYYDKLLKSTLATKVGIAYACQVFEQIPVETHDIKMDRVVYA